MSDIPLVSVVIPTFGRPDRIVRAIESVLAQTYRNIEIIVVDDASSEPVALFISQHFGDKVVCVTHDFNRGAAAARNTGIASSHGLWVAFLDDDDCWLPHRLERQMDDLWRQCNWGPALAYCWADLLKDGKRMNSRRPSYAGDFKSLLVSNKIGPTPVVMVHRACLDSVGGFDAELLTGEDWELWIRVAAKYPVYGLQEILVHQHVHGAQLSAALEKKIQFRQVFIDKYANLLAQHPTVYRDHLLRTAALCMLAGDEDGVGRYCRKSVAVCPWSWRAWRFYLLFALRGVPLFRRLLMRRVHRQGSTQMDGVTYYH